MWCFLAGRMGLYSVSKQFQQKLDSKLSFACLLYIVQAHGSMYTSSWNYPVIIWRISKSCDLNLRDDTVKLSRQIREDADE